MIKKDCVAMILAGGQGARLGALTNKIAKPAVEYGGKYRIIDFPLSNCANSGIDTVGVLTQYQPFDLNTYIGNGNPWDLDSNNGGVYVLPPYQSVASGQWYKGTANAIYQNIEFLERFNPENVLILSGDHIYKMQYEKMLELHKKTNSSITIAVMPVPWKETSRFGIMNVDKDGRIIEFEEKPKEAKSNLASMGIYIFKYEKLIKYLTEDENNPDSSNDFGKNVIPLMLKSGEKLMSYLFKDYWKDVGTVESLWEANMDLLTTPPKFNISNDKQNIYSRCLPYPPQYISDKATITNCTISRGAEIHGKISHSIISYGVSVDVNTFICDSVIMSKAKIGKNVTIKKAIIGEGAKICDNVSIGVETDKNRNSTPILKDSEIVLIGSNITIKENSKIPKGTMIQ